MANVDELDWLGKQLESFDRYELLQFNAAVERFGLSAADELIDLSFCAREVTVISDFSDLELVGKRHYLTVHGACDSEELENLDGKETALALISGQPGYVTRYGVVYDNGIKLEQAYDRKHLPPIWMPESCILELKLRATGEDDPKKQEWVQLPASRIKLERAMLRAGIASCGEMQMLVSDSRFPDEVDCALDFEHESLFELNRLCHACSNFKEQDFVKLGAVCQMAKPTCAANIRQLAENLDQFDFAPNVHTPEELGKYMIQQSGHYEYDENLEDFYNYGDYGVKRMLQDDGVFVDRGYVSYHGTLTLDELMQDDPAEKLSAGAGSKNGGHDMVTLFLRQGENGKQVLLSFPATTPAEKADVAATLESFEIYVQNGHHSGRGKRGHEFRAVSERRRSCRRGRSRAHQSACRAAGAYVGGRL